LQSQILNTFLSVHIATYLFSKPFEEHDWEPSHLDALSYAARHIRPYKVLSEASSVASRGGLWSLTNTASREAIKRLRVLSKIT